MYASLPINKNQNKIKAFYYRIRISMKNNYSFSKYNTGHPNVNPNHPGFKTRPPHDVFPEDIECVLDP